jgi:hypothetical protein
MVSHMSLSSSNMSRRPALILVAVLASSFLVRDSIAQEESLVSILTNITSVIAPSPAQVTTPAPTSQTLNSCTVGSFQLHYATGNYTPYLDIDLGILEPFRESPAEFGDGFCICYEPNPLAIQVMPSNVADCTSMGLKLTSAKYPRRFRDQIENSAPYFSFGNLGSRIHGKILEVGEYQFTASPNNDDTQDKTISFEVFDCGTSYTWNPPNECNTCRPNDQVCIGSVCVDKGHVSFNLLLSGETVTDMDLIIRTPTGEEMNYDYFFGSATTGAYLSGNGYGYCCKCRQKWVKSFVFPSELTAPKGNYSIELRYLDWCMGDGTPMESGPAFELQVYVKGTLVQTFTDPSPGSVKKFNFQLL